MINYENFYNYLCELCLLYKKNKSLKGMSEIAKKYGVKSITKEQFFQFELDKPQDNPSLFELDGAPSRALSDAIRKDLSDLDRLRKGGSVVVKQAESVFGDSLPWGLKMKELLTVKGSPYKYALCPDPAIDNAGDFSYMIKSRSTKEREDAIQKQIDAIYPNNEGICEFYEFMMPSICCTEWIEQYNVAFVKAYNNGTSFWLAEDKDILRLLAWIAFIVE